MKKTIRAIAGAGLTACMALTGSLAASADVNFSGRQLNGQSHSLRPVDPQNGPIFLHHCSLNTCRATQRCRKLSGRWLDKSLVPKQMHSDGTTMFGSSGSTQFPYLLGDPRVRYEYADWNPVMASGTGGVAYLNAESGAKFDGSANNLQGMTFIYGNQGATRLDLIPALAWKMLGMNVEHVMGVKGRGDGRKMFESGEATIDYQTSSAFLKNVVPLVAEGKAVPMMTWGALGTNGDIVRDPTFPDVPTFKEVCNVTDGCETSGAAWEAWKAFFIAGFPSQKIAFLPAGTPQDVIDTYVAAFEEIRARPDFAEISAKRLGKYPMYAGDGAKQALGGAITVSDSAKSFVTGWLQTEFGVSLN